MDDPNITMEEYIRLEEEKAQKRGKVFNWETAKYGKIWNDEDIHDLRSIETEFPAITFNDEKNSFSYKILFTNDLKTDSENDNEKVMPSLPSPEPAISCFDDLDFFKDFEKEFPAIVYNDAQTSKSDLSTEVIFNPQHIDELDLNDNTSLSEYDEEEQNVFYFNDLFPFNIVLPDDLYSEKDNDDNDIDIIQSSEGNTQRLERIYSREIHRVQVVDFQGMPELMKDGLFTRMVMQHRDDAGVVVFTSQAWGRLFDTKELLLGGARRRLSWRQFILALGLHTEEEMESPGFARFAVGRKSGAHISGG
ncbi:hypothetical protein Tco_0250887 [Tanacetum coccineum]